MTDTNSLTSRIDDLEADNRRLRRLLEQRDAPGELRHRLRSTVTLLRAIIRKSAATPRSLEAYADHIEGRLDALARAQAEADERGGSDLHKLIADELLQYGAGEGERLTLSGPDLCFRPRAGQVFALAVHELAVNSVEHGALGSGGQIAVTWRVAEQEDPPLLTLSWHETFGQAPAGAARDGFGTEVLTRMLAYELEARVDLDLQAEALTCTVEVPLAAGVGWLVGPADGPS